MATMSRLWHVGIDDRDWEYDRFESAVVWADTPEQAEEIIRAAKRYRDSDDTLWIESPEWRLHVRPAAENGVALVHWHAG